MATPTRRLAPLQPWQVGLPRYVVLWFGVALSASVSIWLLVAAVTQHELPVLTRVVVVVFAGLGALLCLAALESLLTGGAKVVTVTITEDGLHLARAGVTSHVPWSRLTGAGISARRTRLGDRGGALDLWFRGKPSADLEALGTWVSDTEPKAGPKERRLRIASMSMPALNQLAAEAPERLGDRWLGRYSRT